MFHFNRTATVNVLIVDDNEMAADLLQELLSLQDHAVCCAYNARQALEAFGTQAFDAALVDLNLPDQPGTVLAQRLREQAAGRPLLLVAVSGYAADGPQAASAAGLFDHYLAKPIDFDALDRLLPAAAR